MAGCSTETQNMLRSKVLNGTTSGAIQSSCDKTLTIPTNEKSLSNFETFQSESQNEDTKTQLSL